MSYASGTNKPHIGYSAVDEVLLDHINPEKNLVNQYKYYTADAIQYFDGINILHNHKKETVKSYSSNYELGKPMRSSSSGSETFSSSVKTNYITIPITTTTNPTPEAIRGIYIEYDETLQNRYPYPVYNSGTSSWHIDWMPPDAWGTVNGSPTSHIANGLWYSPPIECNEWSSNGSSGPQLRCKKL